MIAVTIVAIMDAFKRDTTNARLDTTITAEPIITIIITLNDAVATNNI